MSAAFIPCRAHYVPGCVRGTGNDLMGSCGLELSSDLIVIGDEACSYSIGTLPEHLHSTITSYAKTT